MKRLLIVFALLPIAALAQWSAPPTSGYSALNTFLQSLTAAQAVSSLPATCTVGKDIVILTTTSPGTFYYCDAPNHWTAMPLQVLVPSNNLSDLANAATARTNLGLGSAATQPSSAFEVPLTFTGALSRLTNTVSCLTASGSQAGCLSSTDWATFNGKQNAISGAPGTWPSTFAPSAHASTHMPGGTDALSYWGTGTRPVAASALGTSGNCVQWTAAGLGDTGSPCGSGGSGANALGYYLVNQTTNAPANAFNLGALSSGLLKLTVSGGVATPSIAAPGTDYGNMNIATTTGADPSGACTQGYGWVLRTDVSPRTLWYCDVSGTYRQVLTSSGTGPYQVTSATGTAPATPASGSLSCWMDSTSNTWQCVDSGGNASTTVHGATATTHQFVTNVDSTGTQQKAQPAAADVSGLANQLVGVGGTSQTARNRINLIAGSNVTITPSDNAGSNSTDVTISSTGGGSTGVGRAVLSATWGAINDGACQEQTATWTGVSTSDTVILGIPSALASGVMANGRVSASNTVAIRLCNFSGASVTPGALSFNGTLAIYNLSGTGTIDFTSIPDGACQANTFTLTGISAGDPIAAQWPSSLESGLVGSMLASASNTVQVRLCNWSGAAVDPASNTFGASVAK